MRHDFCFFFIFIFFLDVFIVVCYYKRALEIGGLAQLGEHLPYKQRVSGSSPLTSTIYAGLAQLVEQLTCNQ